MRMWGGRFEGASDERMAEFTRSIDFDCALAVDDIAGSIAHVHGLGRAGLLAADEVETLVRGLEGLRAEVEAGKVTWDPALEDIHMNPRSRCGSGSGLLRDGFTPAGRATTRSRRTCVSGCAARSTVWTARSSRWSGRWSVWPIATARRSCRG
jgi:hypothetical protein